MEIAALNWDHFKTTRSSVSTAVYWDVTPYRLVDHYKSVLFNLQFKLPSYSGNGGSIFFRNFGDNPHGNWASQLHSRYTSRAVQRRS
jgi:hypothetical protein